MDAGKERGVWAKHELAPEFVTIPGRSILAADPKEQVASGIKTGFSLTDMVLLARSQGMPVNVVAGTLEKLRLPSFM
jgi:hypothetical protein